MSESMKRTRPTGAGAGILVTLCCLVTAAHFLRHGMGILAGVSLGSIILPWISTWWARRSLALAMGAATVLWVLVTHELYLIRLLHGAPWIRMVAILLCVTALHLVALWIMIRKIRREHGEASGQKMKLAVFLLSAGLLIILETASPVKLLIGSRFSPVLGGLEAILLGYWGVWVAGRLSDRKRANETRLRIWRVFSLVFFTQFILGIFGYALFLMTGKLHIPVPGVIVAGVIFRGGGWVMVVILIVSLLLAGTAWCSHLCYFGAWDHLAARQTRKISETPRVFRSIRPILFAGVVLTSLGLRLAGAGWLTAVLLGVALGLVMIPVALLVSRKKGVPVYCRHICPLGLVVHILGKISPWRVTVSSSCNGCSACLLKCRNGALTIEQGKCRVNRMCTLCRDCFKACSRSALGMNYMWGSPMGKSGINSIRAEQIFVALITIIHVIFIGTARV